MTPEEQRKAARNEVDRKRRAAMTAEKKEKMRGNKSALHRKRKAAMTPEERSKIRSANAVAERKRRAAMTPEAKEKIRVAKAAAARRRREAMTPKQLENMRKADAKVHREKYAELVHGKLVSKMSDEEKNLRKALVSSSQSEGLVLFQLRQNLNKLTTDARIERLMTRTIRITANSSEKYGAAANFIKKCLLEIGGLCAEVCNLKKQLTQIMSEAVKNAINDPVDQNGVPAKVNPLGNFLPSGVNNNENVELLDKNNETCNVLSHDTISFVKENYDEASSAKKFECLICSKRFETSLGLTIHQKKHITDSNHFKCSVCLESFSAYNYMSAHYLQNHSFLFFDIDNDRENLEIDDEMERSSYEMDFLLSRKCLICFKQFDKLRVGLSTFSNHIISDHSENKEFLKYFTYICSRCDKPHTMLRSLETHWKSTCFKKWKSKDKNNHEFICDHCGSKLSNQTSLSSHVKIFHTGKQAICEQCGSPFKNESSLKHHIFMVHQPEYKFSCEHCDKKFKTRSTLKNHTRIVHLREKSFVCKFCSRGFACNISLDCHVNTHTGEKPYECKSCGKSFAAKSSLTIHEGVHEGYPCKLCGESFNKYYELCAHRRENHRNNVIKEGNRGTVKSCKRKICDICGKVFNSFCGLYSHKRYNHGKEKFVCDVCGKIYTHPGSLNSHKISHDGLIRYGCNLCERKFRHATNFYKHRKVAHVNENAKLVNLISETSLSSTEAVEKSARFSNLESESSLKRQSKPDRNSNTQPSFIETSNASEVQDNSPQTHVKFPISRVNLDREDSPGQEDHFSEIEFGNEKNEQSDHQYSLPPFEIRELRNNCSIRTQMETTNTPNSFRDETIIEKTPEKSLPGISKFIDFSRAKITLGPTSFNDESRNEEKQNRIVTSKEINMKSESKDKVYVEDAKHSFLAELNMNDLVKVKIETMSDMDDVVKYQLDHNGGSGENGSDYQVNIAQIKLGDDIKPPRFISSSYPVVKLRRLLEYRCDRCDKTIFSVNQCEFRQHSRTHQKNITQKKKKCKLEKNKSGASSSSAGKILSIHDCLYCSKTGFLSTTKIIDHCALEHPGKEPLKCKICSKMFTKGSSYIYHKSRVHNESRPNGREFLCQHCGKKFTSAQYMNIHVLNMHQERKFQCNVCSKLFFSERELNRHKIRHQENKPHLCEACGKSFFTAHELTDHVEQLHQKIYKRKSRLVHNPKKKTIGTHPFTCNICQYAFKKESALQSHLEMHDPQRKFACDECGLRFKFYTNVITHKDYKHKKNGKRNIIVTPVNN